MLKNILIKGELEGRGIVNFDDTNQSYTLNKHGIFKVLKNNVKLAKKAFIKTGNFVEDNDGNKNEIYDYKAKISGDCLRHAIFEHDIDSVNNAIMQNPYILATYMLSSVGIMRGYMFTCKDDVTYKRKSPLTITDAIQCNDAKTEIEVGSTTGDIDVEAKKRTDVSLHYSEKAGDMKYEFSGQIDIKQLQFISADLFFDRIAINSDLIDSGEVEEIMTNHYGSTCGSRFGHFTSIGRFAGNACCEYGIHLSSTLMDYLIKKTLKDMLSVNIVRNNAYASMSSLKIKLVDNIIGTGQKMNDEDNWIELKNEADIDALNFGGFTEFFREASGEDVKERNRMIEKQSKLTKDRKEKKVAEKEEKKQRKNATIK